MSNRLYCLLAFSCILGGLSCLPSAHAAEAASDDLETGGYAGGSGWADDWTETNDGGTGAGSGVITNNGSALQFTGDSDGEAEFISRGIDLGDLPANGGVLLTFDVDSSSNLENSDEFGVYASGDGGTNWTEVRQFDAATTRTDVIVDISDFASASTRIRFGVNEQFLGAGEFYTIDNVELFTRPIRVAFATDEFIGGTALPTATGGGSAQIFDASNQPYIDDGLEISLVPAAGGEGPLMVFDSEAPTGGDTDLGTPNGGTNADGDSCPGSPAPGVGGFGVPGGAGENCRAIGNSLIISEDGDATDPDDSGNGGVVTYTFHAPVEFSAMKFIDDISSTSTLTLNYADNTSAQIAFSSISDSEGNGENGKFFVSFLDFARVTDITSIVLDLDNSSGSTNALFVTPGGIDYGDAPDSYSTADSSGGPSHRIDPTSVLRIGDELDSETDGQPSAGADGDDAGVASSTTEQFDDEDGVTLPSESTSDGIYTATVDVTNETGSTANLCGWMDFDQDGAFQSDESVCTNVASQTGSQSIDLVFTVPVADRENTGTFVGRFRVTTDALTTNDPTGAASDGEVEDHQVNIGTLPVSIAAFDSRFTAEGLYVAWGTVSETRNAGFHIWGETGDGFQRLNAAMIPASTSDAVTPANYARVLAGIGKGEVTRIAITAVDTGGREEMYGLFEVGRAYGNKTQPAAIDWVAVRAGTAQRLQARGFARAGEGWRRSGGGGGNGTSDRVGLIGDSATRGGGGGVVAVDVRPAAPGMQRVSYQDLADAGLDLAGVAPGDIAVTLKGKGVARHIAGVDDDGGSGQREGGAGAIAGSFGGGKGSDKGSGGASFGPGAFIDFWAEAPAYPDALYLGGYVYRVELDAGQAVPAATHTVAPKPSPDHYTEVVSVNDDNDYHFANVAEDPWYAARLRAGASNDRHVTAIHLDSAARTDRAAKLAVTVSGLTDFPEAPDHRVQVSLNGQVLETVDFDGRQVRALVTAVPAGLLQPGANSVEVLLPGGTGAAADIVLVDTVELRYPRALQAQNNRLSVDAVANTGGLTATGFTDAEMLAYAFDGNRLWTLPVQTFSRGSVQVPTVAADKARYWLSTVHRIQRPEVLGGVSEQDLLDEPANYLIIAHPSLMPPSAGADHPLNDYIAQREAEGWRVGLYDLAAIQVQYGHGMALPGAVTRFLEAAEQRFDYQHVLLVGDDSYDYRDHLGLGSVSFIPTRYTATTHIPHTPSDALLADLDGDGVGDKAIGRWPVRSETDLAVIVQKTLDDWPSVMAGDQSALWVTDSEDSAAQSFQAQAERMIDPLEAAGWPDTGIDRVYFDQIQPDAGETRAEAARAQMIAALEQGKSLTGFAGHGAPSMWTFQGLLTPDDVSAIDNEGLPTLISTLTCYTSYFVSPHTDTLAHRLLNGYREDAAGNPIPGVANGAVAIHGAATLSDYSGNETFAKTALQAQLQQGATLGEAILLARQQASAQGLSDVARNWTLLGDPTLTLQQ